MITDRRTAEDLDKTDALADLRGQFEIADTGLLYLDGHSLGRLPKAARARLLQVIDGDWGRDLVASWEHWVDWPLAVGDRLGRVLLGAGAGQVAVADSTSVNLYKLAAAALARRSGALVTDRSNFPTDRYVLEGLAHAHGVEMRLIEVDPASGPDVSALEQAAQGASFVCLSLVDFRSGALGAISEINEACRRSGALMCWDLSHAVGAVEIDLDATGTDLAIGCTYKYLNAGPGSPAFAYVRRDLQADLRQPIWGWFGQRDQFVMGPAYDPVAGMGQHLTGTPSILGLAALDAAVGVIETVGIHALRQKGLRLMQFAMDLSEAMLANRGFTLGGPRQPEDRGSHLSLHHPDAYRLVETLSATGVMGDVRPPDLLRFGLAPAYTRFVDVWDALHRLQELVDAR